MSRRPDASARRLSGFPRVSGDEPWVVGGKTGVPAFSPRERG